MTERQYEFFPCIRLFALLLHSNVTEPHGGTCVWHILLLEFKPTVSSGYRNVVHVEMRLAQIIPYKCLLISEGLLVITKY